MRRCPIWYSISAKYHCSLAVLCVNVWARKSQRCASDRLGSQRSEQKLKLAMHKLHLYLHDIRIAVLVSIATGGAAVAAGCNDDSRDSSSGNRGSGGSTSLTADAGVTGGGSAIVNPCENAASGFASRDAADLFAATAVPTFDLYLPADEWEKLKANARDEQYVPAQACFQGQAIGLIGLRFKGSYGSLFNCFDSSGKNTCRKLGMKIKFDEYQDSLRFFGLKRLNFQGYRFDDSYLKERLSYDLFRSMNIAAPRAAWAQVRVNGELQGLFGMVEQIDGRFIKSRWPDNSDGNLFKELWPGQTDAATIANHLETNEDSPDVSAMQAFSSALNTATNENLRATLGSFTDLDYLARYMAVDDAIANFDGIITYYTTGGADEAGNHNFYFYQQSPNLFTMIPWDLEATLSMSSNYGSVPAWQTMPEDCNVTYPVWGGENKVIAPGCDRVFRALAADLTPYHAAAQQLLDGPFSQAQMLNNIDSLAGFIQEAAKSDPHGPGAAKFQQAVGFIRQDIPRLRRRLQHLLTGDPSSPLTIAVSGVNDFESADDYGLIDGTTLLSNPNTENNVELSVTDPLAGNKTLRISFNFGNEETPWQQWLIYHIPMATIPSNVAALTGIKLKIRSNAARKVRLDIISPYNSQADTGANAGWDLDAGKTSSAITVLFADAAVPSWADDPGDDLVKILKNVTALSIQPTCNACSSGQIAATAKDDGWVDVDDIEFF